MRVTDHVEPYAAMLHTKSRFFIPLGIQVVYNSIQTAFSIRILFSQD